MWPNVKNKGSNFWHAHSYILYEHLWKKTRSQALDRFSYKKKAHNFLGQIFWMKRITPSISAHFSLVECEEQGYSFLACTIIYPVWTFMEKIRSQALDRFSHKKKAHNFLGQIFWFKRITPSNSARFSLVDCEEKCDALIRPTYHWLRIRVRTPKDL